MIEFKKYPEIESTHKAKFLERCIAYLPDGLDTLCQVTEKLHGANFAFYLENGDVKTACRNSFCESNFMKCTPVIEKYTEILSGRYKIWEVDRIIYGELVGKGINKGVDYGDKDFYAFDIRNLCEKNFSSADVCYGVSQALRLKHVPVIHESILLRDALEISPIFQSRVIETDKENMAEGLVIKPIKQAFLPGRGRIIFRKHAPNFYQVWRKAKRIHIPPKELSQEGVAIVDDLVCYLTVNRLVALFSKHDGLEKEHYGKIGGLLVKDALLDYESYKDLKLRDNGEYKLISRAIMSEAIEVVKQEIGEDK